MDFLLSYRLIMSSDLEELLLRDYPSRLNCREFIEEKLFVCESIDSGIPVNLYCIGNFP